ncbi:MAG: thiamine pyrophosphate-binding protein [bacterium]|nr:thiamine pyrophosphate-binding protein [bacterium]
MLNLAEKKKASLSSTIGNLARQHAPTPEHETEPRRETSLVGAFVQHLSELGIEQAFGVSGGAIALLFDAITDSDIGLHHFRHETGAAFAATEAYFANRKPSLVFATTGPGVLNAITGMTAARWEGAKVVLVSGATSAPQRGRHATQETSSYTLNQDALYTKGPIFDFAIRMEQASELPEVARRLALGLARPGGFVAHVCLPMGLQSKHFDPPQEKRRVMVKAPSTAPEDVAYCAELLKEGKFAIWAGFGATEAAPLVQQLAERSGAKVLCSPRGKGIVPENHPLFVGVTGLGGHDTVADYIEDERPERILVLGTKLGEATSFWDQDLVPPQGFVHVDIDPDVPGTAFPDSPTIGVQAEIGHFVTALLEHFPKKAVRAVGPARRLEMPAPLPIRGKEPVRPQVLMSAIQRRVVQATDAMVLAECGNAFAWCNHYLRFSSAGRYRVSTLFGSMGHTAAGVVGAAMGREGKAVAVVGDGSMLMNSELSTAAQYQAPAVWIVLNDGGYGMCRDGHRALGLTDEGVDFQQVDFAGMARAVGVSGTTVETEDQLDAAIDQAMAASGPFVVDVRIDASEASPLLKRFESLIKQGNSKNVAGWEA